MIWTRHSHLLVHCNVRPAELHGLAQGVYGPMWGWQRAEACTSFYFPNCWSTLSGVKRREIDPQTRAAAGPFDVEHFRRQQTTFAVLNLFLLAILLLFHTLFSDILGSPSARLLVTLGAAFLLQLLALIWLRTQTAISASRAGVLLWASIVFNLSLAVLFTFFVNRAESPYWVLLALPVLQAAYHFRMPALIGVIATVDSILFFWVWHFATFHSRVYATEYPEAGIVALIYSLVGLLVWSLVKQIRADQDQLKQNMLELDRTRVRLAREEKLAAVGRLSSAIAHEIRNPVAMIASSMATAESAEATPELRKEMYSIASAEATRLEKLTSDFLSYARPVSLNRTPTAMRDLLGYVAEIAKPYALHKQVTIAAETNDTLCAEIDSAQIHRALLNLVMNAVDAAPSGSTVYLRASSSQDGMLHLEVEDRGSPIDETVLANMFEPFYTTKPQGTGLGLAIARNIARSHGGDVFVARNEPEHVCFTLTLKENTTGE